MNVDDLMTVWRSQDAAPLDGVNETLLRLALREAEAKLQKQWRVGRRVSYISGAVLVGHLAFYLFLMSRHNQTGWDYAFPIVGTAALLFWLAFVRTTYRTPAMRGQKFGTSLRDQLNRHIVELDFIEKKYLNLGFMLGVFLPLLVGAIALFFTVVRAFDNPISIVWTDTTHRIVFFGMILYMIISFVAAFWVSDRIWKRKYLPRKQGLEILLKELDEQ